MVNEKNYCLQAVSGIIAVSLIIIFTMQEDLKGARHPTVLTGGSALTQGTAEGNDLAQGIVEGSGLAQGVAEGSGLAQGTATGNAHAQGIAEESTHARGVTGAARHMEGTLIEGDPGHQSATGITKQIRERFPSVMNVNLLFPDPSSNCVAAWRKSYCDVNMELLQHCYIWYLCWYVCYVLAFGSEATVILLLRLFWTKKVVELHNCLMIFLRFRIKIVSVLDFSWADVALSFKIDGHVLSSVGSLFALLLGRMLIGDTYLYDLIL
jgi:hypothetical protein